MIGCREVCVRVWSRAGRGTWWSGQSSGIWDSRQEVWGALRWVVSGNRLHTIYIYIFLHISEPQKHVSVWKTFRNKSAAADKYDRGQWGQRVTTPCVLAFLFYFIVYLKPPDWQLFQFYSCSFLFLSFPSPVSSLWWFAPVSDWLRPFCSLHKLPSPSALASVWLVWEALLVLVVDHPGSCPLHSVSVVVQMPVPDWSGVQSCGWFSDASQPFIPWI